MKTKKLLSLLTAAALMTALTACGGSGDASGSAASQGSTPSSAGESGAGAMTGAITVISREDGSGTRSAFVELTGVEDDNGDNTTVEAEIQSKTDAVLTSVAGNEKAIGYISLGSLNGTVKAVMVDGVEATTDNVKSGSYKLSRPFNIATKGEPTGVAADFINFILSADGQKIIEEEGYISVVDDAAAFTSDGSEGQIAIAGSSSVYPVMEKLVEAYKAINANAQIDLQSTDSSSGMTGTLDGTLDIGMASRELKDSEKAELTGTPIAMDGIAVIVNPNNAVSDLTMDQIRSIYVGETTEWDALA